MADDGHTAGADWEANGEAGVGRCGVSTACRDGPCRSTHGSERSMVPGHGNRSPPRSSPKSPSAHSRSHDSSLLSRRGHIPPRGFRGRGRRRTTDTRGSTVLPTWGAGGTRTWALACLCSVLQGPLDSSQTCNMARVRGWLYGPGSPRPGQEGWEDTPRHPLPGPPCPHPSRRP